MDRRASSGANRAADEGFDFQFYRYSPSLAAAILFVVIYAILTAAHIFRLARARAFYFIPFAVGGVFELVGYSGRIWSHYNDTGLGGFIIQAILILVAPALFAASIYMILGRLIRTIHAEHLSVIPVRWLTKIFVVGDVISFAVQASGGGIQAGGTLDNYNSGEKIIVTGLFLQIAFFGFFVITTGLFHRRIVRQPTHESSEGVVPWTRHLIVLYAVSIIILVRSIFRVVEYLQGNDGYIISHEAFLYVFDAFLMMAVMVILLVYYVSDLASASTKRNKSSSSGSDQAMNEIQP